MHRAHSKRKYKNKEGTIHCAPTIQIQIKTINLYFRRTGVSPVYVFKKQANWSIGQYKITIFDIIRVM